MYKSELFNRKIFMYGLPVSVILISIILGVSPMLEIHPEIAIAITYDLTFTAPLLFLFLARKKPKNKLKTVPFFVSGILIATLLLPKNLQEHLNYIKTYMFPIAECFVLILVIFKSYKSIRVFKSYYHQGFTIHDSIEKSVQEMFGASRVSYFISSEIVMLYYLFFSWRKQTTKHREFSNYKENATIALCCVFLLIITMETFAFHIALSKWSIIIAWILSITSIYAAFMIIAHLKALIHNPSILTNERLYLKNGLLSSIDIDLKNIAKVEACTREFTSSELAIGNLGLGKQSNNHNISIYFKQTQTVHKTYGFMEDCDILLFHMDDKNKFLNEMKIALKRINGT